MVSKEDSASLVTTDSVQNLTEAMSTMEPNKSSIEANDESPIQGDTESNSNNNAAEIDVNDVSDEDRVKKLKLADKGSRSFKENAFDEAIDFFSRALDIRVSNYGLALLQKAIALRESYFLRLSNIAAGKIANGGPSAELDSSDDELYDDGSSPFLDKALESLNIARDISNIDPTKEKVDIICALGDVLREQAEFDSSLNAYKESLSIVECMAEPYPQKRAEINLKICDCLTEECLFEDAILYCQRSIVICRDHESKILPDFARNLNAKLKDLTKQRKRQYRDAAPLMMYPSIPRQI